MKTYAFSHGPLRTNTYLLKCDNSNSCIIIDPGMDHLEVIHELKNRSLTPKMILLTHGHYDHSSAVTELIKEYDIPFYIHSGDEMHLAEAKVSTPPLSLSEGNTITLEDINITVWHTPGHSEASSCFITDGAVFSGDTLFCGCIGRTDFPGGSHIKMIESLKRFKKLPRNTTVYPGHGRESTIGEEMDFNPYIN